MILYFTGIDGAGKTTVINKLKETCLKDRNVEVVWGRYTPRLVRFITSIVKRKKISSSMNYNGMSEKDYSSWKQFKKTKLKSNIIKKSVFAFQVFDYMFQVRKIENKIKKNKDVLIIDRYILDFLVDQSINYGNITDWFLSKYLLKKLNKIKSIFFIDIPIEIAFKRKKDIPSLEYLDDRKKVYLSFSKICNNIRIISNDRDIKETIKNINNIIENNK